MVSFNMYALLFMYFQHQLERKVFKICEIIKPCSWKQKNHRTVKLPLYFIIECQEKLASHSPVLLHRCREHLDIISDFWDFFFPGPKWWNNKLARMQMLQLGKFWGVIKSVFWWYFWNNLLIKWTVLIPHALLFEFFFFFFTFSFHALVV